MTAHKYSYLLFSLVLALAPTVRAQDYDTLIQQALDLRNREDFAGAEVLLRQAYPIPPDKSEVATLLGLVLAFQEKFDDAIVVLESELANQPSHPELRLALARVQYFTRDHANARRNITQVLEQDANNLTALILAGRVELAARDPAAAQQYFEASLAISDQDIEALVGLHDALMDQGEIAAARQWLDRARAVNPDYPEVIERLALAIPDNRIAGVTVAAGFSSSDISLAAFPGWTDRFVEIRHQNNNGNQQYFRVNYNNRFNAQDTAMEAGVLLNQSGSWPVELAVGHTPDAVFMYNNFFRLGVRHILSESEKRGAVVLTGLYQYSDFNNGNTDRYQLGLEYYLPGVEAWLTPAIGMVRDQFGIETFAWNMGGHWQLGPGTRIGGSYGEAPETENLITTDSKNSALYLRQNLGDHWLLFLNWSQFRRTNSYARDETGIVLQYRFNN
jgi:YaiO family outer membrane protein